MGKLENKVALISGGARGLGRAMAEDFVAEGARVVIGDVLSEVAAETARELGDQARSIHLDVTTEKSWADAVQSTLDAFGSLNVLVNNAGTAEGSAFADTTLESYRRVTEVNQTGVFLGMRAAVEPMTSAGGGSIINISSIDGMVVAMELAPLGIRVNSVHPGHVHTLLASEPGQDRGPIEAMIEEHTKRIAPMGRTGLPSEIAKLATFLASEDSSYCTGAEFVADGGFTAGYPSPGSSGQS
jgi:3alpha(or 20beta)-hydroxysteroid dehydrogenase